MKIKHISPLLIQLTIIILLSQSIEAISIGVSPSRLDFNNVLPGGYSENFVTLSTNANEDLFSHAEVKGDIANWIRLEPNSTSFAMSAGKPYRLKIIIEPPEDAPIGDYSGQITFITDGFGSIGGRAGGVLRAAVNLQLNLKITGDEIVACRAGGFSLYDTEIGFPVDLALTIINDGNTRINPPITIDIWDQMQETLIETKELSTDRILPTAEQRILKEMYSNELRVGQYWANINVLGCGSSDLLTFSIVEKGSIIDKGSFEKLYNKLWAYTNETVQISATFKNDGPRSVPAKFKGTIRLDDKIVKLIETEELEVPSKQSENFDIFFTPAEPGRYIINGRFFYGSKITFERNNILNVNPDIEEEANVGLLPFILYLIILITILFIIRKIVKEQKKKHR